jgi:hypothetical protein
MKDILLFQKVCLQKSFAFVAHSALSSSSSLKLKQIKYQNINSSFISYLHNLRLRPTEKAFCPCISNV